MRLKYFDVNMALGRPMRPGWRPAATAGDARRVLRQAGIAGALVWHIAQRECAPPDGNRLLAKSIAGTPALRGCWTILPPQTGEIITPDFFARMQRRRIAALRAFPDQHRFLLNRVTCGRFLDEASERGVPLLLSLEKNCLSWPAIYQLMADFPKLTCILCDLGVWGVDRYTWPLLEAYPNLYLETSMLALEDGGLEGTAQRYGAGRLLFGTGFPDHYQEASQLGLLHADIADRDKRMISSGNWEDLLGRICLE